MHTIPMVPLTLIHGDYSLLLYKRDWRKRDLSRDFRETLRKERMEWKENKKNHIYDWWQTLFFRLITSRVEERKKKTDEGITMIVGIAFDSWLSSYLINCETSDVDVEKKWHSSVDKFLLLSGPSVESKLSEEACDLIQKWMEGRIEEKSVPRGNRRWHLEWIWRKTKEKGGEKEKDFRLRYRIPVKVKLNKLIDMIVDSRSRNSGSPIVDFVGSPQINLSSVSIVSESQETP